MNENRESNREVKEVDSALIKAYDKIENAVVSAYEAVEAGAVGAYKAVESGVVDSFGKMTDKIVGAVFTRKGETVSEAKARLSGGAKNDRFDENDEDD